MKLLLAAAVLTAGMHAAFCQYNDPTIPKPTSGYGCDGTHPIGMVSFANPSFPSKNIEIYYPSDAGTKVPTIFYSHAFGGNNSSNVIGLLDFVAHKGYAIVFVPYQTTGVTIIDRYDNLLNGFRLAVQRTIVFDAENPCRSQGGRGRFFIAKGYIHTVPRWPKRKVTAAVGSQHQQQTV